MWGFPELRVALGNARSGKPTAARFRCSGATAGADREQGCRPEYVVLIGRSDIDETHAEPAEDLMASEWQTKARLTSSLVTAGARQWAHQRAVAPLLYAELVSAGPTIIAKPPGWRFRGLVARPLSGSKSSLGTEGSLVPEASPGLGQGSTDRRFVRRCHLARA